MLRRGLWLAFLLTLFAPFIVRALLGPEERAAAATPSGPTRLELRIITPHTQDIRRTFERAFVDWHQRSFGESVHVIFLTPRGTSDMVRYLRDVAQSTGRATEHARDAGVDVVWGGGDVTFQRELLGLLDPLSIDRSVLASAFPEPDLNGVPLYEPVLGGAMPRWVGVVLASFGIAYNPGLYRALALPEPETWQDLARPELADLVALADPTRSGSAATAYMMVLQRAMADRETAFLAASPGDPSSVEA